MANNKKRKRNYSSVTFLFLIAGFILLSFNSYSQVQTDTTKSLGGALNVKADKEIARDTTVAPKHSPSKAALYSALLPGLGQAYNHKYWKIPIVYAGVAAAGTFIYYNYNVYRNLQRAYKYRKDNNPETQNEKFSVWTITGRLNIDLQGFQDGDVLSLQEGYRRDLDLSIIFAAAIYGLNILDAVVDAHLFNFDVSDKLSMNIQPEFIPAGSFSRSSAGVSLNLQF